MHSERSPVKIYTLQFWKLCLSSMLFFASFNMLIPELPAFLTKLGGQDYKGLIISLFTVTAMLSRPFSGKLADRIGRVPVIMTGSVVCFICSLIYPFLSSVFGFLVLRFIHGFSTGFTPTGQAAYVSDIIPAERRGEAMGFLGTAGTLGMAGGPAVAGAITTHYGLDVMFYCSSLFALMAITIVLSIRETVLEKHTLHYKVFQITRNDLFEPRVMMPCIVMILSTYSYGALFTVIPDFAAYVGVHNKGLLFTYFTVASLLVRLLGGRTSDRYGRKSVLRISTIIIALGMIIIAFAETKVQLALGVSLYGLGQGATSPALLAWATDLSDSQHKGKGLASLYIFMELGIGTGAFMSGLLYNNQSSNFFLTFIVSGVMAMTAFVYLMTTPESKATT